MRQDMEVSSFGRLITEIAIASSLSWLFKNIENYNADTYYCPQYCGADHKHKFLDLQSDFDKLLAENDNFKKNSDLAVK